MHKLSRTLVRAAAVAALIGLVSPASADLVHRYSFTTNADDSVGTAHGQAVVRTIDGTPLGGGVVFTDGQAILDGLGAYIDLPNGIFSPLTNVTIEVWATVNAYANWSRLFDIGTSTLGEITPEQASGTGLDYMFLTPSVGGSGNTRFAITDDAPGQERPILSDPAQLPLAVQHHIAVAYGGGIARLYVDGVLKASGTQVVPLSALQDVNNWLGRSQFNGDAFLNGAYNEFRVHSNVLSGIELKASSLGSPDTLNYDPGTISAITLQVEGAMLLGQVQIPIVTGTFSVIGDTVIAPPDVTISSTSTNIVYVETDGRLRATGIGSSVIKAERGTQSASFTITVAPAQAPELKHRYSFNEAAGATDVVDSVSAANATAFGGAAGTNAVLFGNGSATFPSAANYVEGTYLDLPDGLISSKTNITIETWVTWAGPGNQSWQRIFDFGASSKLNGDPHAAGAPTAAHGYLFLTTRAGGGAPNPPRFAARPNGGAENPVLNGTAGTPLNQQTHFVVVYANQYRLSKLYVNGIPVATGDAPFPLANVSDVNNWIGLAQFNDPPFNGSMSEFRIYEGALTDLDVALHRDAGPDALPIADPGPLQTVSVEAVQSLYVSNNVRTAVIVRGNFANISNVDITGLATFSSSDTNIFNVNTVGGILPRAVGTATLTATVQNKPATTTVTVIAPTALRQTVTNKLVAGQLLASAALVADFPGTNDVNVNAFNGITHSTSDTNVITVAANGNITAVGPGTATITSTYGGQVAVKSIDVVLPDSFRRGALVNRYSFDGAADSTVVTDSVGGMHGEFVNGAGTNFTGTGQLALPGGAGNAIPVPPYVNLPNGLVTNKGSVTLEGWATVRANTANTRLFDFGMSSGAPDGFGGFGEDVVAAPGRSYMFLTPFGGANPRFAIKTGTAPETPSLTASGPLTVNQAAHYALVYDQPNGVVRLYVNGVRVGTAAATLPLNVVDDRNNWLGRSQWVDPFLNGVLDEFRIWDGPLLDLDVRASFLAGPNTLPTFPTVGPTIVAIVAGGNLEIRWPVADAGFTLQSTTNLEGTPTWGAAGGTQTVDGTNNKVTIPLGATGNLFLRLQKP